MSTPDLSVRNDSTASRFTVHLGDDFVEFVRTNGQTIRPYAAAHLGHRPDTHDVVAR